MREVKTMEAERRQLEIIVAGEDGPADAVSPPSVAWEGGLPCPGEAVETNGKVEVRGRDGQPNPYDHDRMTLAEALGLVTRIAVYFPNWLKNMADEEVARTMVAWAKELAPLGNREEVWYEVRDFLRKTARDWPPGIFETRRYVVSVLHHKRGGVVVEPKEEMSEKSRLIMEDNLAQVYRMLREKEERDNGKQNR